MSGYFLDDRELIESGLGEMLPSGHLRGAARLNEAIRYSIFPGGKRMRPMLALLAAAAAGGTREEALPAACATEFLHASSLIFDDLPAMDDADVRRGRPALHLVFGEDVALLTALALLNRSYEIFGGSPRLMREAVNCIGINGMIGGQAADLNASESGGERNRKTTALMRLTFTAGAIACEACPEDVRPLARAGELLGEAYQIYDDVLDECGSPEDTGKTAFQDARHHRMSNVAAHGVAESLDRVAALVSEAKETLTARFGDSNALPPVLAAVDCIFKRASAASMVPA